MTVHIEGEIAQLSGDLSIDSVRLVWEQIRTEKKVNVIDFSAVSKIDSAVLACIFALIRRRGGRSFELRGVSSQFMHLAELYGVVDFLVMQPAA